IGSVKLLYRYLRRHWGLVLLALVLASLNQVFSLLDPLIFRHVIDTYALRHQEYSVAEFLKGVTLLLLGAVGVAFVSRVAKTFQKVIVAETTALAGATTESLRNIELVKSLGLAQQEMTRLNKTTDKILGLELKKVRYLRSLSFIQGTAVNALRTSILFMMLY